MQMVLFSHCKDDKSYELCFIIFYQRGLGPTFQITLPGTFSTVAGHDKYPGEQP